MAIKYENLKGVKPLYEFKSRIENDIINEMLEEDDDLNANYLSEEKELIKERFSKTEEINDKIREICIKASLNTEEALSFIKKLQNDNQFWVKPFTQIKIHPSVTADIIYQGNKLLKFEFENFQAQFQNCVKFGVK